MMPFEIAKSGTRCETVPERRFQRVVQRERTCIPWHMRHSAWCVTRYPGEAPGRTARDGEEHDVERAGPEHTGPGQGRQVGSARDLSRRKPQVSDEHLCGRAIMRPQTTVRRQPPASSWRTDLRNELRGNQDSCTWTRKTSAKMLPHVPTTVSKRATPVRLRDLARNAR